MLIYKLIIVVVFLKDSHGFEELQLEMKRMRRLIVDQDKRIRELESRAGIVHEDHDHKADGHKENGNGAH